MKKFGKALLGGILGYVIGVVTGIGLVSALGSPRPDSSQEAVMTGFFFIGPVVGLLAFIGTLIHQLRRRQPSRLLVLTFVLGGLSAACATAGSAQTRPAPVQDPAATVKGGRPIPGPVYETRNFTRAVERGTRDRSRQARRHATGRSVRPLRHRRAARSREEAAHRPGAGHLPQPLARHAARGADLPAAEPLRARQPAPGCRCRSPAGSRWRGWRRRA